MNGGRGEEGGLTESDLDLGRKMTKLEFGGVGGLMEWMDFGAAT